MPWTFIHDFAHVKLEPGTPDFSKNPQFERNSQGFFFGIFPGYVGEIFQFTDSINALCQVTSPTPCCDRLEIGPANLFITQWCPWKYWQHRYQQIDGLQLNMHPPKTDMTMENHHLKMYFLLNMAIFQCRVSFSWYLFGEYTFLSESWQKWPPFPQAKTNIRSLSQALLSYQNREKHHRGLLWLASGIGVSGSSSPSSWNVKIRSLNLPTKIRASI